MLEVTCALIIKNGKVLITQNDAGSDHPYQWEFPGGKTKKGESHEQCILREIKEELELNISILQALHAVEHDYGIKEIRLIPFVCVIKSGKIQLNHHIKMAWITMDQLQGIDFPEADKKLISLDVNLMELEKYTGKQMDQS